MDKRLVLIGIAAVVLIVVFFLMQKPGGPTKPISGCGNGLCSSGEGASTDTTTTASSLTSKLATGKLALVKTNTYEIIPQGLSVSSVWKPEINKVGNEWYYSFNKGNNIQAGFEMLVLDENFNQEKVVDLFSGTDENYFPTDFRTAEDNQGNIWYAFESAKANGMAEVESNCASGKSCEMNQDSIALYTGTTLSKTKTAFTTGCIMIHTISQDCFINKPSSDDPTVFFYNGNYYVLIRYILSPKMTIREFDKNLNVVNQYELSLPVTPVVSPNAVFEIESKLYLIAGVGSGKKFFSNYTSSIYAFELASDFSSVKNTIKLTNYNESDVRVTSARYHDGKLFFTYQNNAQNNFGIYLEAFDVNNNFAPISRIKVTDKQMKDGHNSIEVSNGKIYVAYVNGGGNLAISEFELTNNKTAVSQISSSQNTPQNQTPSGTQNPAGNHKVGGYCGDGICQDIEKSKGVCSQDCH